MRDVYPFLDNVSDVKNCILHWLRIHSCNCLLFIFVVNLDLDENYLSSIMLSHQIDVFLWISNRQHYVETIADSFKARIISGLEMQSHLASFNVVINWQKPISTWSSHAASQSLVLFRKPDFHSWFLKGWHWGLRGTSGSSIRESDWDARKQPWKVKNVISDISAVIIILVFILLCLKHSCCLSEWKHKDARDERQQTNTSPILPIIHLRLGKNRFSNNYFIRF